MLFLSFATERGGNGQERRVRRASWHYPEGMHVVAEYWLQTPDPKVVMVIEADSMAPIMAAIQDWEDLFEIRVFPAVTAEEGLKYARAQMKETQPA
ncbi:MAG TPA: DUF3303 family protein [Caldilineaceae bacterium]|nr:DUF3303 family protein [Caldilineaceae bacterium]